MGTCSECTVWVARGDAPWRRLRGCLVPVEPGLRIRTERPEA
ncbi:2Fe-2S iron-sulfur cluster-binding protein [Novosphingobium resinovorum]